MATITPALARWNALPSAEAERELLTCCASPTWARAMVAGRPYPDLEAFRAASDAVFEGLTWSDIVDALSAHPRIGERLAQAGREADWSRAEQAGMGDADDALRAEIAAANQAYEQRFGHVFLICATGRSAEQMLAAARQRLNNDLDTERRVVRDELRAITRLRLAKLVDA